MTGFMGSHRRQASPMARVYHGPRSYVSTGYIPAAHHRETGGCQWILIGFRSTSRDHHRDTPRNRCPRGVTTPATLCRYRVPVYPRECDQVSMWPNTQVIYLENAIIQSDNSGEAPCCCWLIKKQWLSR